MAAHAAPLYVEIDVRAPLEELWRRTQTPELHQRWDLRFTEIRYLPRASESEPQRFLYATRIGFGLGIEGGGESVGERAGAGGESTSVLRFWSDDGKSLIRAGSGYWKYRPVAGGVRFVTGYDYEVRFGWFGRALDRFAFRPLIGWATAWSFDRLRLWLDEGLDPASTWRATVVHALARVTLAFTWAWHGLVPKLLARDPLEERLFLAAGFSAERARPIVGIAGAVELVFAALMLLFWSAAWPLWLTVVAMLAALLAVLATDPGLALRAFNPVTLDLLVAAVALIALVVRPALPSARRCRRRPEHAP